MISPVTSFDGLIYETSTGQWGISTTIVKTTGSNDTRCPGVETVSETSQQFEAQEAADNVETPHHSKTHAGVIAGAVVGLTMLLTSLGVLVWWWRRRRNRLEAGIMDGQDTRPRTWEPIPSPRSETAPTPFMTEVRSLPSLPHKLMLDLGPETTSAAPLITPPFNISVLSPEDSPLSESLSTLPRVGGRRFPTRSASMNSTSPAETRLEKSLRILGGRSQTLPPRQHSPYIQTITSSTVLPSSARSSQRSFPRPGGGSMLAGSVISIQSPQSAHLAGERSPDIIIQHLDGGLVEELPPPYLDRSNTSGSIASS